MLNIDDRPRDFDHPPARDLIAEANHRIANSLASVSALVKRQIAGIDANAAMSAPEAQRLLGEVRARIDAVARLHRILSNTETGAAVDAAAYLQQIAAETVATLGDGNSVTLHVVCELGHRIAAERALYLGLIIVELVTNSLKYAHPAGVHGSIAVRCRRDPGVLSIEISDDGVGLPEDYDTLGKGSSGLRLVRALAGQIGGTVTFDSHSLGLLCHVEVPLLVAAK